jgi:hypothetical protein
LVAGTAMLLNRQLSLLLSVVPFELPLNGILHDPILSLLPATRNLGILSLKLFPSLLVSKCGLLLAWSCAR